MNDLFLPYAHQSIDEEDISAVAEALRGNLITRGPLVEAFEKSISSYVGSRYAVAFSSASAALNAAYLAKEISSHDRLLTSPNTFIATTAQASLKGAPTVFVDIDRRSGGWNNQLIEPNLEYKSLRGRLFIVPVHFAGIALDMGSLYPLFKASNLVIIEDAAHALGSTYPDGKKVGCCAYSDMTIFSFHPAKHITTGEGGMVTTNDEELFERLKMFRNSGIVREEKKLKNGKENPWYYEVQEFATNSNFTDFQAALGLSQLKKLDRWIEKRRFLVGRYREMLKDLPGIEFFDPIYDSRSAYHLMVIQIDFEKKGVTRAIVMEELKKLGIGTQFHYIPLYRHPCYRSLVGDIEEYFPEMEIYYKRALSVPLFPAMGEEDVFRVSEALHSLG